MVIFDEGEVGTPGEEKKMGHRLDPMPRCFWLSGSEGYPKPTGTDVPRARGLVAPEA